MCCAGEEESSFGFGGTGKASTDCQFQDYGEPFTTGDVITAYLVSVGDGEWVLCRHQTTPISLDVEFCPTSARACWSVRALFMVASCKLAIQMWRFELVFTLH